LSEVPCPTDVGQAGSLHNQTNTGTFR